MTPQKNRRSFIATAGLASFGISSHARDWTGKSPTRYPDPSIISLDPRFDKYKLGNTSIQRLYTNPNRLWNEGCAWNAVGRYLVFSDVPGDLQLRWIEDDNRVTEFRKPSGNSNGNTFDQPPFSPMYPAQTPPSRTFRQKQVPTSSSKL